MTTVAEKVTELVEELEREKTEATEEAGRLEAEVDQLEIDAALDGLEEALAPSARRSAC